MFKPTEKTSTENPPAAQLVQEPKSLTLQFSSEELNFVSHLNQAQLTTTILFSFHCYPHLTLPSHNIIAITL